MKRLFLVFLLFASLFATAQRPYSPALLFGQSENRLSVTLLFSLPGDTLHPTAEHVNEFHLAMIGGILYDWNFLLTPQRWVQYAGTGGGPITWGSITGSIPVQSDLWALLQGKQPLLTAGDTLSYWRADGSLGIHARDLARDLASGWFTYDPPLHYTFGHFYMDQATGSTPGYMAPADFVRHDQGYNRSFVSGNVTGTTTKTLQFLKSDGTFFPSITWTDLTGGGAGSAGIVSINGDTTHALIFNWDAVGTDVGITNPTAGTFVWHWPSSSATARGPLTSTDWSSFNTRIRPSDTSAMLANYFREVGWGLARTGRIPRLDTSTAGSVSFWKVKQMIDSAHNIPNGIYPVWPLYKINDSTLGVKKYIAGTQSGYLDSSTSLIAGINVYNNGTLVNSGRRSQINFIPSTGIGISAVDNAGGDIVNVTISSSGGSGATAFTGLTDVAVVSPARNQVPTWDTIPGGGGALKLVNKTPALINGAPLNHDIVQYNTSAGNWEPTRFTYTPGVANKDVLLQDTVTQNYERKPALFTDITGIRHGNGLKWDSTRTEFIPDSVKRSVEWYTQFKRDQLKPDSVLLYQFDKTKFLGQQGWDTTAAQWGPYVTQSIVSDGLQITQPNDFSSTNYVSSPLKTANLDVTTVIEVRVVTIGSHFYSGVWQRGTARYFQRWQWGGLSSPGATVIYTDARTVPIGYGSMPAVNVGDIVRIYFRRFFSKYILTAYNLTQGTVVTAIQDDAMIGENINAFNPGLFLLTGTVVLRDFHVYSNRYMPKILFLGASITQDANSAVNYDSSYTGRIQRKSNLTTGYSGGSGEGLYDAFDELQNTIKLKPEIVVVGADLAYNEISNGVAYATWQALHKQLVDTLTKMGCFVIIGKQSGASPNTIPDSINHWIDRSYVNTPNVYIMNWDDYSYNSSYQADNLGHLTDAGAIKYSDNFIRHLPEITRRPTLPIFAYGVYTPVLTTVANVTSDFVYDAQFSRLGNIVTVSGRVDITSTSTGATTYIDMTLPIASNMTTDAQVSGTLACEEDDNAGRVLAEWSNGKAKIAIRPRTAGTIRHYEFIYQYQVL